MNPSNTWGVQRCLTLLGVVTAHVLLVMTFLMNHGRPADRLLLIPSIELLLLPPVKLPEAQSVIKHARLAGGLNVMTNEPPFLDLPPSLSLPTGPTGPTAASRGQGSGVDWSAEARRALQAFEIRRHGSANNKSVSSEPVDDDWWPASPHRAGDRFKTPDGDWIVWINANCYQVAEARATPLTAAATLPRIICVDPPAPLPRAAGQVR